MLSPQLQHPNWDTPLVCLVINCPQKPFRRVIQQRKFLQKTQNKTKKQLQPSSAFSIQARKQRGLPPLLIPPHPPSAGVCCILAPPRMLISISQGFRAITPTRSSLWQQGNLHGSKANAATLLLYIALLKCSNSFSLLRWIQEEYPSLSHTQSYKFCAYIGVIQRSDRFYIYKTDTVLNYFSSYSEFCHQRLKVLVLTSFVLELEKKFSQVCSHQRSACNPKS